MKLFKIFLILVLFFSISFGILGEPTTLELDTSVTDTKTIIPRWMDTRTDNSRIKQFKDKNNPDTLIEWFKNLTLDEKVEIYNWWKNGSVDWKENCIEMPLIIELYNQRKVIKWL